MGKNKSKSKSKGSNVEAIEEVIEREEAEVETEAAADSDNDSDPLADKRTWMGGNVDRLKRAVLGNALNAKVVIANHAIAKLSIKEAESIAAKIDHHNKAIKDLVEDFLGKIPAHHVGVTPSKTGERNSNLRLLKGVKVQMKTEALKTYGAMFSADELKGLVVDSMSGKFVRILTPTKAAIVLPAKSVELAAA